MNTVANAFLWRRRLDRLNITNLGLMQQRDGKDISFDGTFADHDMCAVGKSRQFCFQLVYGYLMGHLLRELTELTNT